LLPVSCLRLSIGEKTDRLKKLCGDSRQNQSLAEAVLNPGGYVAAKAATHKNTHLAHKL
jgi:hypothetical protein